MGRRIAYELVRAGKPDKLSKKVSEKMSEGWRLFGSPFAFDGEVLQAIVLTSRAEKRIRKNSGDE